MSRLALVVLLLILQALVFAIESLSHISSFFRLLNFKLTAVNYYILIKRIVAPVAVAVLGAILVALSFSHPDTSSDRASHNECDVGVDADIAGVGVRAAVWAQIGILVLVSALGSFHVDATGVKEVGAGLILTHISLSIALLVKMSQVTLSPADAIIGAMVLDAQNLALMIQLGAKETLAARWQVGIVVLTQVLGLSVVTLLVSHFAQGTYASDACPCLTVFWWAQISSCRRPLTRESELEIFWCYCLCRWIGLLQSSFHAVYNTHGFHLIEKAARGGHSSPDETGAAGQLYGGLQMVPTQSRAVARIRRRAWQEFRFILSHFNPLIITAAVFMRLGRSWPRKPEYGNIPYNGFPSTITLMYGFYGLLAVTSLSAAELTITNYKIPPTSQIDSVGQIIGLVIAGATVARSTWLLLKLFHDQSTEGFMWPFSLGPATRLGAARKEWLIVSNINQAPSCTDLPLGSLLLDPFPRNDGRFSKHNAEGVGPSAKPHVEKGFMGTIYVCETESGPDTYFDLVGRIEDVDDLTTTFHLVENAQEEVYRVQKDHMLRVSVIAERFGRVYMVTGRIYGNLTPSTPAVVVAYRLHEIFPGFDGQRPRWHVFTKEAAF